MTEKNDGRVHLKDLVRGFVAGIPDTGATLSGVGTLLRVRFGKTGSIGALLEKQAGKYADTPALLWNDQRWSYAQFNAWANRYAYVLAHQGIGSGDCVALLMENHPAQLACVAALAKLGAIAGMLNPHQAGDALRHSIGTMKAKRLVIGAECAEAWRALGEKVAAPPFWLAGHGGSARPIDWIDLEAASAKAPAQNPASTGKVELTQRCYYILTSGTTGLPKASIMTHRRWLNGMAGIGRMALRLRPEDVLYCALPLYHNNGLLVSWSGAMGAGAALALDRKFSASRFWDRIRHYNATGFTYIGELCRYLLAQPASKRDREHAVRVCVGNGLRPDVWMQFKQRFGIERICEFYAASEGNLVFANSFNADATAGFCPLSYAVIECDPETAEPRRDAKGFLTKVAKGGVGLLVTEVTENLPFDGYTDARAGESKLIRDGFAKDDCWYNTGDLVRDQGWKHIAFMDRLGDTFRWKGENVATTEVEAALRAVSGLADSAVYGVQVPGRDGRAGMAAVQLASGAVLDGAALAAHLASSLPAYAVPLFLRRVEALETTVTFKTRKQDLKREGCDPARVRDPLYVLAGDRYVPLDAAGWQRIVSGETKL